jgi:hypothetical protein
VIGADVAPNHGWRHRFKVECTGIIPEATIDYIQDHVPVNIGRKYNRPPPRKLKPFIDKVPRYDVVAAGTGARKAKRAVGLAAE